MVSENHFIACFLRNCSLQYPRTATKTISQNIPSFCRRLPVCRLYRHTERRGYAPLLFSLYKKIDLQNKSILELMTGIEPVTSTLPMRKNSSVVVLYNAVNGFVMRFYHFFIWYRLVILGVYPYKKTPNKHQTNTK